MRVTSTDNAAFAVANNVAPQVEPSFRTANNAYLTANAAFDKANVGGANVAATAPAGAPNGQLWWDTNTGRLFIYYVDGDSSQWVEATPTPEIDTNYYILTNNAFNTANAAYAAANNISPQVTPSYNTANMAFNTANAAFAVANNVAPQVEPSYNTANAAFSYANSLNTYVSVTYSTIVQLGYAWSVSNAAYNTANAAYAKANTAGGGYYAGESGEKGAFNAGDIFRVHSNTMTQSVTILSGNNAICAGPLNIVGANTTLTIQTGARVTIV